MRDAAYLVQGLGYRYLWIDALCIVQDSKDDWLSEASKMSSIYKDAVVTIAVADADDHSQGIFRKRRGRCMRPFHVPYLKGKPYRERGQADGEGEYYVFPKNNLVGAGARPKGTLDTRGWILQEQLLSTRILYYDHGEIYWDCITVSASESSPILTSLLDETDPDETWALKLVRRTLAGQTTDDTLRARISDAWLEIIKNYSARELTRQSDKLIAMEGILDSLKGPLQEEHIAGMWRYELWRQLTWWARSPAPTVSTDDESNHGFPAPSWSWLSATGPVCYHNCLPEEDTRLRHGSHKFTELRPFAFELKSVESQQVPGATGVTGTMVVSAQCFAYRLTAMDLKRPIYRRWNKAKLELNTGKWMLDRHVELPLDIHCLIVAEETAAKLLVCLCVAPSEHESGVWKRIGLCHWEGLAWYVTPMLELHVRHTLTSYTYL